MNPTKNTKNKKNIIEKEFVEEKSLICQTEKIQEIKKNYDKSKTTEIKIIPAKELTFIEVIEDQNKSVLEKVNFIRRMNINEYASGVNFETFILLLRNYERVENFELEGWIEKIISQTKIKPFFHKLLLFLEN